MSKSEGQVLDFEKICRLCLLEKRSMSSIFAKKKSDKKVPLPVRIMSCASLELYEGDGLPASICSKCLLSVNQSYAFREQCEQADTTLRQYAQRMNEASGETSLNREPRELIANDSLAHIEDFGNKCEEHHEDEDEERGGDSELNTRELAKFSLGNVLKSSKNFKENELLNSVGKVVLREEKKVISGVKGGLIDMDVDLPEMSDDSKNELEKCFVDALGVKEKIRRKVKVNIEAAGDSAMLKAFSMKKAENVIVAADVPVVLEVEDCDFSETESPEDGSLTQRKTLSRFRKEGNDFIFPPGKEKGNVPQSDFEDKKHLELLQNLMKKKNIIVKKRTACDLVIGKMAPMKNQEFSKSLRRRKGLSFPYDFKIAQFWKEWEEVNRRIPKILEKQAVSARNEETELPACRSSAVDNEESRRILRFEDKAEVEKIEESQSKKRKNGDTVYCKDCRIFLLRRSYGNHIKFVHKKIRKYLCQVCGYAACTGTILRQHVQAVHVGYSFFCDQCPRKFNLMKRLRKHVELHHSGKPIERNHICQYCGMAFVKTGCLNRHLRSHTQEAPYQCQYCHRRFKYRWPKKQHERLHTGEKPYKCSFCEERFTQNCVRKAHEYKKHGNEEFRPKIRAKERSFGSRNEEGSEASHGSCNSDNETS